MRKTYGSETKQTENSHPSKGFHLNSKVYNHICVAKKIEHSDWLRKTFLDVLWHHVTSGLVAV